MPSMTRETWQISKPLIRWAGSKRQLIPILKQCIPPFNTYIEPFAGSACLFFELRPARAILSDYNRELIQAFRYLRKCPAKLFFRLHSFPRSRRFYYQLRSTHQSHLDDLDKAARFFYLNRYCFNGVYRTNRDGRFNVPKGTRTGKLLNLAELRTFSRRLRGIGLKCRDFELALDDAQRGDFIYLDPPYTSPKHRNSGEYGYGAFNYLDLSRLVKMLRSLDRKGAHFLLSYAQDESLQAACSEWSTRIIAAKRHVAGFGQHRMVVREILIANYELPKSLNGQPA
jgi:DNA adenine methylase